MQIIVNIILSFSLWITLTLSITIIYQSSKFFHIAHAIIITSGAYFTYLYYNQLRIKFWIAIILAVVCSVLLSIFIELLIYKPLRKKNVSPWKMLISSLGIYIIFQNIISLIWGDETKTIRDWKIISGNRILGAYITKIQVISIILYITVFSLTYIYMKYSTIGKKIKAVSSNEELSEYFGINTNSIVLISFVIGSFLASICGILIALDTDISVTMGFRYLILSVVIMIISGIFNIKGLIYGALLLSVCIHISGYLIGTQWMDAITYLILILFLIWKPLGFSGRSIRKREV